MSSQHKHCHRRNVTSHHSFSVSLIILTSLTLCSLCSSYFKTTATGIIFGAADGKTRLTARWQALAHCCAIFLGHLGIDKCKYQREIIWLGNQLDKHPQQWTGGTTPPGYIKLFIPKVAKNMNFTLHTCGQRGFFILCSPMIRLCFDSIAVAVFVVILVEFEKYWIWIWDEQATNHFTSRLV